MPDSIVSVRMPESLLEELKKVAAEQHYMDLSEAVRGLVRRKLAEKGGVMHEPNHAATQQLIEGLQRIISQLEDGAKQEQ